VLLGSLSVALASCGDCDRGAGGSSGASAASSAVEAAAPPPPVTLTIAEWKRVADGCAVVVENPSDAVTGATVTACGKSCSIDYVPPHGRAGCGTAEALTGEAPQVVATPGKCTRALPARLEPPGDASIATGEVSNDVDASLKVHANVVGRAAGGALACASDLVFPERSILRKGERSAIAFLARTSCPGAVSFETVACGEPRKRAAVQSKTRIVAVRSIRSAVVKWKNTTSAPLPRDARLVRVKDGKATSGHVCEDVLDPRAATPVAPNETAFCVARIGDAAGDGFELDVDQDAPLGVRKRVTLPILDLDAQVVGQLGRAKGLVDPAALGKTPASDVVIVFVGKNAGRDVLYRDRTTLRALGDASRPPNAFAWQEELPEETAILTVEAFTYE
jgi:hypothetical protein